MTSGDTTLAALKAQFETRRRALVAFARAADGVVDPAQWAELERLQRLIELEAAAAAGRDGRTRMRTVQIAIAGVVGLGIITLLLVRFPTTHISLQVQATHASMTLQQEAVLTRGFAVRWIVAEGQAAATMTGPDGQETPLDIDILRVEAVAGAHAPIPAPAADRPRDGAPSREAGAPEILVRLPAGPAGTRVDLDAGFDDGTVAIGMCGLREPIVLNVSGGARVAGGKIRAIAPGETARVFIVPAAAAGETAAGTAGEVPAADAAATPCPAERELRLRFQPATASLALQPELAVGSLQLFTPVMSAAGVMEPRSTLLGGSLQLLSVKVPVRTLQKHELLEPVGALGRMRSATLAPAALTFDFDGQVSDLVTGSPYVRESMMPRLLQWILSQELLLVAWSSGLTVLGVVLALYRWFGGQAS